jgi:hypothetical protein
MPYPSAKISQVIDFIDLMGLAPQAGFEPATLQFNVETYKAFPLIGSSRRLVVHVLLPDQRHVIESAQLPSQEQ